jgi:hypothetical protein
MTTTTPRSRRAILAAAAALPALATMSSIRSAHAAALDPSPDAELIELGRQFLPAFTRWLPKYQESGRTGEICAELYGDLEGNPHSWSEERLMQEVDAAERVSGYAEAHDRWAEAHDEVGLIVDEIIARKATTLAGLEVQAFAVLFTCSHFWTKPHEEVECDEQVVRALVESVLSAGMEPSAILRQFKEVMAMEPGNQVEATAVQS